jgi:hypothetical protein
MTQAHARLSPSSAGRWVKCPGSPRMEAQFPGESSEAAREGTAAHWALSETLSGRTVSDGQVTPDGFVLTDEMVMWAERVVEWIAERTAHHGEQPQLFIEHRGPATRIHADCWGTMDIGMYFPISKVLEVTDYKYGFGWVEAFENWQLICYVAILLDHVGANDLTTRVRMWIIQPRAFGHPEGPIRKWSIGAASDLRGYINTLNMAAEAATAPDAKCVVNFECRNCSARMHCPTFLAKFNNDIQQSLAAIPFDLTPHAAAVALSHVRRAVKDLEALETGLSAQIEATLRNGAPVPFWKLEQKPGNLEWTVPVSEILMLGDMMQLELRKPAAPVTPKQAEKAGLPAALLVSYAARGPGVAKLVPVTDADVRKIFN